jgi:hypothetical protein
LPWNTLGTAWWDESVSTQSWASPYSIGGAAPASAPVAVIARKPNWIDAFVAGRDGFIDTTDWPGGGAWVAHAVHPTNGSYSVQPGTPVSAVSRYASHLDVFFTAVDGSLVTLSTGDSRPGVWGQTVIAPAGTFEPGARGCVSSPSTQPESARRARCGGGWGGK